MKLNCQKGDLAIIVKDDGKLENLGLIVRVVSQYGMKKFYSYSHRNQKWTNPTITLYAWTVEVLSENSTISYGTTTGKVYSKKRGWFPDSYLKRLPKLCEENTLEENLTVIKSKETV